MSIPIGVCIMRAALTDDMALMNLLTAININERQGHFSVFTCPHNPKHKKLTIEEGKILEDRLRAMSKKLEGGINGKKKVGRAKRRIG